METQEILSAAERNRIACRKWYQKNKVRQQERKRDYMAKRRIENPEVVRSIKIKSYHNRKEDTAECRREKKRRPESRLKQKRWNIRNPISVMLTNAKMRSKKYGLDFSLDKTDIVIPDKCPVLGIPLIVGIGGRGTTWNSPSLDRVDNSKGYTPDNVRVISYRANALKSDATPEEIRMVLDYMEGRK